MVLGENCEEYIVKTTIIVEKETVIIANKEPAIVESIVLERS
jgi:hypothetical protein